LNYIKKIDIKNKKLFVIGDVHGCYNTLEKMISKIPKSSFIVFLGDIIDKGPNSRKILNLIRNNENYQLLLGNHELRVIYKYLFSDDNINTKNKKNKNKKNGIDLEEEYNNEQTILLEDIKWLNDQPRIVFIKDFKNDEKELVLSHTMINREIINNYKDLINNNKIDKEYIEFEKNLVNNRIPPNNNDDILNIHGHIVINKHDNNYDKNNKIIFNKKLNYINIDTGVFYNSKNFLTCLEVRKSLEFNDMKFIYMINKEKNTKISIFKK